MNIALCANTSWYLYNFRRNLIAALQKRGHQITAIAPPDEHTAKLQALGVRWYPLQLEQTGTNPLREAGSLLDHWRTLDRIRADWVLTFTVKCNLYAGLAGRFRPFKHIANVSGLGEGFDQAGLRQIGMCMLYRLALRRARRIFFQNSEDMQSFMEQGILPAHRCEQLPGSGVDLTRFTPGQKLPSSEKRIFLMFGRIVPKKGYDLFLDAIRQIQDTSTQHAEFWILGIEDRSRKDSRRVFERIVRAHQDGLITYWPPTDDVVAVVRQADVVVLPSLYHEGVPRCLLEAMACGKPLLTTDWKGCRDTVEHGVNGYLIKPGDAQALEHYLRLFIQADQNILAQMGSASRKKAEREFDEQQVIATYLDVLSQN